MSVPSPPLSTRRRRRVVRGALALAVAALAWAPPAGAATIGYDGDTLTYAAAPGETLNTRVGYTACQDAGGAARDCATFSGDAVPAPPSACGDDGQGRLYCLLRAPGLRVVGGDGNDIVSVFGADLDGFPATTPYPIAVDGGAGNDKLVGGDAGETIHGGVGADEIVGAGGDDLLYGDDGNDVLRGDGYFNGNESSNGGGDRLYGGAGDDTLTGDSTNGIARIGADVLDGGPGTDTVTDDWYRFDGSAGDQDPPPTVSLDGVANDGRPGEGDNVAGVERIDTGYLPNQAAAATFVGSSGPDTINLLFAHGTVQGGDGDDVLTGSDYADAIDGGAGNDKISGGFGDDVITGGPGQDDIGGDRTAACFYGPIFGSCTIGSGNDTIYAQDGERDTVDCGPGADAAYVDAVDVTTGCETVHVAGVGGTPPGGGPSAGPTPPAVLPLAPRTKVAVAKRQRLRAVSRVHALAVTCRLSGAGRCRVVVTITAKAARKLKLAPKKRAKTLALGSAAKTLKKAGTARLKVRLAKKMATALRRAKRLRVTITATATAAGHRTRTVTIHATLKR